MIRTWNGHVGFTFCEGAWADPESSGVAELTNCLSSFVLLGVGIKGGLRSGLDDFTRLLYGALTVCGIGSVLFHAHLIEAFRFIDEMAILYLVCLGFYVAALDYFHQKNIRQGFDQDPRFAAPGPRATPSDIHRWHAALRHHARRADPVQPFRGLRGGRVDFFEQ